MNFSPSLADVMQSAEKLIAIAIAEDIGSGDATSKGIFPPHAVARANIIAKEPGIVAGLPVAKAVYAKRDPNVVFSPALTDGVRVNPADILVKLEGPLVSLLSLERIVLNFLQHLSGIATLAAAFVEAVRGTQAVILDTRKTTPGYRVLEKYAVRTGGAQNQYRYRHDPVRETTGSGGGQPPQSDGKKQNQRNRYPKIRSTGTGQR